MRAGSTSSDDDMGRVQSIHRYPVKSCGGETLDEVGLTRLEALKQVVVLHVHEADLQLLELGVLGLLARRLGLRPLTALESRYSFQVEGEQDLRTDAGHRRPSSARA